MFTRIWTMASSKLQRKLRHIHMFVITFYNVQIKIKLDSIKSPKPDFNLTLNKMTQNKHKISKPSLKLTYLIERCLLS